MASPRFDVDFEGIGANFVTMKGDGVTITYDKTQPNGSAHTDKAVKVSADDTVALATDASRVFGRIERVEPDGKVVVQFTGFAKMLRDSGTALAKDVPIVGALSGGNPGYIRAALGTGAEPGRGTTVRTTDATACYVLL